VQQKCSLLLLILTSYNLISVDCHCQRRSLQWTSATDCLIDWLRCNYMLCCTRPMSLITIVSKQHVWLVIIKLMPPPSHFAVSCHLRVDSPECTLISSLLLCWPAGHPGFPQKKNKFNQSFNQSVFVYYGMTKCRPTN